MFTDNHELGRLIADRLILLDQVMTMRAERDRLMLALEDKHASRGKRPNFSAFEGARARECRRAGSFADLFCETAVRS